MPDKPPTFIELIREWIFRHFGIPGMVGFFILCAFFYVYMNWAKVKAWPGIAFLVELCSRHPIPTADKERFSVMIARLENDPSGEYKDLIIEDLKEFKGINVLLLDRTITLANSLPEDEHRGHETALSYLNQSGADVIIWGKILSKRDEALYKLYWTHIFNQKHVYYNRYQPPRLQNFLHLPKLFWKDLSNILKLLVATGMARFDAMDGYYVADQLKPFINRVRTLLKKSARHSGWDADARSATYIILADALSVLGKQDGQNEPLKNAVDIYRKALKEYTRERVPLQWAETQNDLGVVLQTLGERERGTVRLEERNMSMEIRHF